MKKHSELPIPEQNTLKHSQTVFDYIVEKIQENGGILPFSEYMDLALYAPGLGYYNSGTPKLGRGGDFFTAPEISPLFGQCVATQCQEILEKMDDGDILEFGAGSGKMAAEILSFLSKRNALPNHYYILEVSPFLKAKQQETIKEVCPELINRIKWLERLPDSFTGIILANEVLDAMPVERFKITKNGILRQGVTVLEFNKSDTKQSFNAIFEQTDDKTLLEFYASRSWDIDYESEINLNILPWIQSISDILKKGVVLLMDYGFTREVYYHPVRNMGTLMCHYQQIAHTNPFIYPGIQDITAHVDFTAIQEAAHKTNLEPIGFTNQASFLLSLGLLDHLNASYSNSNDELNNMNLNRSVQVLTSPNEMGELFKVIALGRNIELQNELLGFSLSNKLHLL